MKHTKVGIFLSFKIYLSNVVLKSLFLWKNKTMKFLHVRTDEIEDNIQQHSVWGSTKLHVIGIINNIKQHPWIKPTEE